MGNSKRAGVEMLLDTLEPTVERLRKDEFSQPQVDNKNNRRAWRRLDVFQVLLRDNKIQSAHNEAGQRFIRHYMGRQKIDCRITDLHTVSNASLDGLMDPWQWHGACLAELKQGILLPDEYSAMEYVSRRECEEHSNENPIVYLGSVFGGYKSRKEAHGYGYRLLLTALERLAYHWGLKQKGK